MKNILILILGLFSFSAIGQNYTGQNINEKLTVTNSPTVDLDLVSGDLTAKVDTSLIATKNDLSLLVDETGGTVQATDGNSYNLRIKDEGLVAGNARNEYTIDLQARRFNANEIPESFYSGIFAGQGGRIVGPGGGEAVILGGGSNLINQTGLASGILGSRNSIVTGQQSAILAGQSLEAIGPFSIVSGYNNTTETLYEVNFGGNSTEYTPVGAASNFDGGDRLFNIGNGETSVNRSDAVTILKNAQTGIGIDNFEANTTGELLQVNGDTKVNEDIKVDGQYLSPEETGIVQLYDTVTPTTSYLNLGSTIGSWTQADDFYFEFRFRIENVANNQRILQKADGSVNSAGEFMVQLNTGDLRILFGGISVNIISTPPSPLVDDQWYIYRFEKTGTTFEHFLDGTSLGSVTDATAFDTGSLGRDFSLGYSTAPFAGSFDYLDVDGEVFTFNEDLTSESTTYTGTLTNGALHYIEGIYSENFYGANLIIGNEIDMQGNKIVDLADPTNDQDAATKIYIDQATQFNNFDAASKNSSSGIGAGNSLVNSVDQSSTFYGYNSGTSTTTGILNTAFGTESLTTNTTGRFNTAVGFQSMNLNLNGDGNVGVGRLSLSENVSGTENIGIGLKALYRNTTGNRNVGIGYEALGNDAVNTTGSNNIGIGWETGDNITSGSNNIAIGYRVHFQTPSASNQMNIGNFLYSEGIGTTGTIGTGNLGIGVSSPTVKLDIDGDGIRIRTAKTPSSASDTGVTGQIAWDSTYIYICVATDTWHRVMHLTW